MSRIDGFPAPQSFPTTEEAEGSQANATSAPANASPAATSQSNSDELVSWSAPGAPFGWSQKPEHPADATPTLSAALLQSAANSGAEASLLASFWPPADPEANISFSTLDRGARGPAVGQVQLALKRAGYRVAVDDKFGNETARAVLAFQKAHFADPAKCTGVVDAATMQALADAPPAKKSAHAATKRGNEYAIKNAPDGTPMLVQGDGRWGTVKLGDSESSIHKSGCFLTSLTMVLNQKLRQRDAQSVLVTPEDLNAVLRQYGGFQPKSALLDNERAAKTIERVYGVKVPVTKVEGDSGKTIAERLDAEFAAHRQVRLHVDNDGDGTGNHFVVFNRKEGDEYVIIDPA